jgi:two-component system response regulator ResD
VLKNCYRPPLNELHNTIDVGNIKIYTKSNRVMLNNEIVHLTPSEYNLLLLLAQNVNQTVSTEEMYNKLWSTSELRHTSRGLQMHLSKLRRKLNLKQDQQVRIITIHGKGYCLQADNYNS